MKNITRTVILIAAAAAAFFACKKDDTLRYNNAGMGILEGNVIISDEGNTFDIVELDSRIDLKDLDNKRVMILCDILKETSADRYDIRLKSAVSVLTKECVNKSSITEDNNDYSANNPLIIKELWYSGGYLNMFIEFARKTGSETVHYINLLNDDTISESGKYTFTLLHDAKGETPSEDDKEYSSAFSYVSFPIAEIITEDEAKITLKWKSHKFSGSGYSLTETEDISNEYDWKRESFEQNSKTVKELPSIDIE
jgi:hypothetical protein